MNCIWCKRKMREVFSLHDFLFGKKQENRCSECKELFTPIGQNFCRACGRDGIFEQGYCFDCVRRCQEEGWYIQNQALFVYNDVAKEFMNRYKFQGECGLAWLLKEAVKESLSNQSFVVVPLPTSNKSLEKREFHAVSYILDVAEISYLDMLVHIGTDKKQSEKTRQERLLLKQPFKLKDNITFDKEMPILLVDDVYTTGTTLLRAYQLLRGAGFKEVQSLTYFR